jgi:plastocyanin
VRITLKDMGAYPHNIVIPGLEVTSATVTGDPGGAQVSFTVTFAHAGRYSFHCQYHASAGMTGVFVNCPVGLGATLVLSGGSGREPGCPGH